MQKTTKKASILIWSLFLSLIVSMTFISISTKINKNIKNNANIRNNLEILSEIRKQTLNGSFNNNYSTISLNNDEEIIFESHTNITKTLKKNESFILKFPTISNITITLTNSGALKYKTTGSQSLSGTISYFGNVNSFSGTLEVSNIAGFSSFKLISDNTFLPEYSKYKIMKKIGNKTVIKQKGEIKNF